MRFIVSVTLLFASLSVSAFEFCPVSVEHINNTTLSPGQFAEVERNIEYKIAEKEEFMIVEKAQSEFHIITNVIQNKMKPTGASVRITVVHTPTAKELGDFEDMSLSGLSVNAVNFLIGLMIEDSSFACENFKRSID